MSYCVECGVELHEATYICPLCQTPVIHPNRTQDDDILTPFPKETAVIGPASKKELALLLTTMFTSVCLACILLSALLPRRQVWVLYVVGAMLLLFVWVVPPLVVHRFPAYIRLPLDALAVAPYLYLVAYCVDSYHWFFGVGLPVVLMASALLLALGYAMRRNRRSYLTSAVLVIAALAIFLVSIEFFVDRWLQEMWDPSWSVVVLVIAIGLASPLVVVRRSPALREEVRRRLHL